MANLSTKKSIELLYTDSVQRTEYSAHNHWDLVQRVTGINVNYHSDPAIQQKASSEFVKKWDYGLFWNILTWNNIFDNKRTKQGHAVYAAGGVDFDTDVGCPFDNVEEVYDLDFFKTYGEQNINKLTEQYDENYQLMEKLYPNCLNHTGIYVSLMSAMIEILGWGKLLLAAGEDEQRFGDFADRCAEYMLQYVRALSECQSEYVMIHDDITWTSGAFMKPEFYKKHIFNNYSKYTDILKSKGKKILYTSDGNFSMFFDDLVDCGFDCYIMEPCCDMKKFAIRYGNSKSFVGGFDTMDLLLGDKKSIQTKVKNVLEKYKQYNGYIFATGNHIPSNTPVDNVLYYEEAFQNYRIR